ncbi:MAG: uracil-DNA glycosylase [Fibrobacteres bacterium]|nr:uracil-DNA glycosylase [Fibrobacterota bacterium]
MMATTDLLRAYLEWQSDMGTEEVILPHALARRQTPAAAAVSPLSLPSSGVGNLQGGAAPASKPGSAPEIRRMVAEPAGEPAPSGLFQSLSQALEEAASPKRLETPQAPGSVRSPMGRLGETGNLPVFQGLADFWDYLEGHPQILQAEIPAAGSKPETVTQVIRGFGPAKSPLALVGFEPGESDAATGKVFQGDVGALLEKMLRAIRLDSKDLYLSNLVKIRVAGKVWSRRELARIVPLLHIELGLAQVPAVLLLGLECAQTVLKTGKTLDELRQETHRMEGREFFVTYHPQELLRKEELKRKAWEDLQWLQRRMAEAQART